MIEINLLPEEFRKKESFLTKIDFSSFSLKALPVIPIAIVVIGFLVLVQVLVLLMNIYFQTMLTSLTKTYAMVEPDKKVADALKAQTDTIHKKIGAIDDLMGKRFSWAKKLNTLSDAMIPGIWLTDLNYDERPVEKSGIVAASKGKGPGLPGTLTLTGYAAGSGEQGAGLVGKLIKNLKDSEEFYSDFNQIELVSIKSSKVKDQEVMNFKINCVFK